MALIPGPKISFEDVEDSSTVPAGQYNVMITGSEVKETSSGNGSYLKLTFRIVEGPHEGRLIWSNLNLVNPNEKAVEIARRELKAICQACGLDDIPEDSFDLHGIEMLANVGIVPASGGYGPSNNISRFKAI